MKKDSFNNFSEGKKILDACCGSRMFWFDKENKDTLYIDKRNESLTSKDRTCKTGIRQIEIKPDLVADFTNMPFADESFYLVVFDPPHLKKLGNNSWLAKKYGKLTDNWKTELAAGFKECMRVLKPNGTLIFKWNETDIKVSEIITIVGQEPLFGHKSGKMMNTHWLTFFKSVGKKRKNIK